MVVHAIEEPTFSEQLAGLTPLWLVEASYPSTLRRYNDRGVAVRRFRNPKETARPLEWTEELPSFAESLPGDQLHIFVK